MLGEAGDVGEVAGLVDAVDIGFFGCEGEVFEDFFFDGEEEVIGDEGLDDSVVVAIAGWGVRGTGVRLGRWRSFGRG